MIQNKLSFFFKHQIWHLGGTIILFYIAAQIVDLNNNINTFLGISALNWFIIAMSIPLIHQAYVWICWRSELCWQSISNTIGFKGYVIIFFILIISRLSAIVLCFLDFGSLYAPGWFAWSLAVIIFIPIAINLAYALNVDTFPFIVTVILAANLSFLTPFGYQTNLLVMAPGQYKFIDYMKCGIPLTLFVWIIFILFIPKYFGYN